MKSGLLQYLDLWARNMMPAISMLFLAFLNVIPTGLPAVADVTPLFTMMAVFYWAVYRPDLIPPSVVFCIGLLQDILLGNPVGLLSLTLLGVLGVTLSQRQAFIAKPFVIACLGFAVIATGGFALMWVLTCLLATQFVLTWDIPFQLALTVMSFPIAAWIFVRVHRYLVR